MAEIEIQKKEGPGPWIWLIGLLVVGAVAWMIIASTNDDENIVDTGADDTTAQRAYTETDTVGGAVSSSVHSSITDFVAFAGDSSQGAMGLDHDYTAAGINHLAGALSAMVDRFDSTDVDMDTRRDTLMQRASRLQADRSSLGHANIVHETFTGAAQLMSELQDRRFPALDAQVNEVEAAARAINPATPLLDQREAVKEFFRQASAVLNEMARQPVG